MEQRRAIVNSDERRFSDRVAVSLKATTTTDDALSYPIKVSNISPSGLQFLVNEPIVPKLFPHITQTNTLKPVSLMLNIELKAHHNHQNNNDCQHVKVQCGIVYVRRKSREEYFVGCRFEKFIGDSNIRLQEYIQYLYKEEAELTR